MVCPLSHILLALVALFALNWLHWLYCIGCIGCIALVAFVGADSPPSVLHIIGCVELDFSPLCVQMSPHLGKPGADSLDDLLSVKHFTHVSS